MTKDQCQVLSAEGGCACLKAKGERRKGLNPVMGDG